MHGLYPASKYPQGLRPQLLVRCVYVSSPFVGFWVFSIRVRLLMRLARACSSARFLVKLHLLTVNVYFPMFSFRDPKDENLYPSKLSCKRLTRMNVAFALGIPHSE